MSHELLYSTRREFLSGTLKTVSLASTMPGFLARTAAAMAEQAAQQERILVVVQLSGGNDGLNTVVPFGMEEYYRLRPTIGIAPNDCLKLSDQVGLHPDATGLKALFDDGKLAIVQGVGYPNPNRSHFKSMDIWHTADPAGRSHTGWLGNYFDACCPGSDPVDPQSAVALMSESPLALSGDQFTPLAFDEPDELTWRSAQAPAEAGAVFEDLNNDPPVQETHPGTKQRNETLDFLRRAALDARLGADQVRAAASHLDGPASGRRNGLRRQLALVSSMIAANFPTTVYYVSFGGFDTHSRQNGRHRRLLAELGNALSAFVDSLKSDRLFDRVVIMTFSEFGRRVCENSSGGTDHGAAAPMFVIGGSINPGLHQPHPSLTSLDRGDLVHGCDFRRVYASVLRDWLGADHRQILRGNYPPLKLIKRT